MVSTSVFAKQLCWPWTNRALSSTKVSLLPKEPVADSFVIRKQDTCRIHPSNTGYTPFAFFAGGGLAMGVGNGCSDVSDIVAPMYASAKEIANYARNPREKRPVILCEYYHAMGNSVGDLLLPLVVVETLQLIFCFSVAILF